MKTGDHIQELWGMVNSRNSRFRRTVIIGISILGATAGSVLPASAGTAEQSRHLRPFYEQKISWNPCSFDREVECASVEVPLDYSRPSGERISVAISRQKATDSKARRGVLFYNPGGPGGSGLTNRYGKSAPKEQFKHTPLNAAYDLIGFDPRGIGKSAPLRCENFDLPNITSRPSDKDFDHFATWAEEFEKSCDKHDGQRRKHFNTPNTARDMNVIRAALDERRINYVGYSYGTYLGTVYGSLFPSRLDRSVLDSSVHPDETGYAHMTSKAEAARGFVEEWAGWAAERDNTFRLGPSVSEVMETVEAVSSRLAENPVDGWDRNTFDAFLGFDAEDVAKWQEMAERVAGLKPAGNGLRIRTVPPAPKAAAAREVIEAATYTILAEGEWPQDIETYREQVRANRDRLPYGFGPMGSLPMPPAFRSFTPPEALTDIERDGYPRGIVVQAKRDSQTPYAGGVAMAKRLGNVLISVDDHQHAQYASRNNRCVDEPVTEYLMQGTLPSKPVSCPAASAG
ncbi:alpha/beta fold hydrolase [Streptomyces anulatus]|uniref:alpha/beta fold hydrolase n=1 Tax=Streptomyces anulatus TaxID=1892 RepID=UPI00340C0633